MASQRSICDWLPAALGLPPGGLPGQLAATSLDRFELLQTPGLWGQDPSDNAYWTGGEGDAGCMPPASRRLVELIEDVVAAAERWLDIAALQPLASGEFAAAIRRGLARAAANRTEPLTVRILYGRHDYPLHGVVCEGEQDFERFVADLAAEIPPSAAVRVHGAFLRTWEKWPTPSWNHAKIIAADGRRGIVGGHNLWHDDYLSFAPVHDVSAFVEGEGVGEAHRFLDVLWGFVAAQAEHPSEHALCHAVCWSGGDVAVVTSPSPPVLSPSAAMPPARRGGIPAIAVGRLGVGVVPDAKAANVAAAATTVAFSQARRSIRLSQMDFGLRVEGVNHWRDDVVTALAEVLTAPDRSVEVSLVLSEVGAEVAGGGAYSFGTTYEQVASIIREKIAGRPVTGRMRLAPIRFSAAGQRWKHDGRELMFCNHAKVWIVDETLLHVGSDNIYPHTLQEFGYIIGSETIVRDVVRDYWEPLWRFSSQAAIDVC